MGTGHWHEAPPGPDWETLFSDEYIGEPTRFRERHSVHNDYPPFTAGHTLRIGGHHMESPWVPSGNVTPIFYADTCVIRHSSILHAPKFATGAPSHALEIAQYIDTNFVLYGGGPTVTPTVANSFNRPAGETYASALTFSEPSFGYNNGYDLVSFNMRQFGSILEYIATIDAAIFWQHVQYFITAQLHTRTYTPFWQRPWFQYLGHSPTLDSVGGARAGYYVTAAISDIGLVSGDAKHKLTIRYHQKDFLDHPIKLDMSSVKPVNQPLPNWPAPAQAFEGSAHLAGMDLTESPLLHFQTVGTQTAGGLPGIEQLAHHYGLTIEYVN